MVSNISIRIDPRFSLEENWLMVEEAVAEAQKRGILVTPLTVFSGDGIIAGWYLHGWEASPPKITLV